MNMPTTSATAYNIPYVPAQHAPKDFGLPHTTGPRTPGQPGSQQDAQLLSNAALSNASFDSNTDDFFDMEAWLNADDDTYN